MKIAYFILIIWKIFHAHRQNKEEIDVDDLLPQIGEFGRYQKLLIWLVCLPACIPCGFGAFNQLFMQQIPDHWCKTSALSHLSADERKFFTIPLNNVRIVVGFQFMDPMVYRMKDLFYRLF